MSSSHIPPLPTTAQQPLPAIEAWKIGVLAWLIPGAGHLYQGRAAKGILFFVCILGTFFYGISLGSSRCVYASFRPHDYRLTYVLQAAAGLPALPAVVQYFRIQQLQAPQWNNYMAPPVLIGQLVPSAWAEEQMQIGPVAGDFQLDDFLPSQTPGYHVYTVDRIFNPPAYLNDMKRNQYSVWCNKYSFQYELGTLFTLVAGLLNLLVIFDAVGGPALGKNLAEHQEKLKRMKLELEARTAAKRAARNQPSPKS